jgi:hypothetical protein
MLDWAVLRDLHETGRARVILGRTSVWLDRPFEEKEVWLTLPLPDMELWGEGRLHAVSRMLSAAPALQDHLVVGGGVACLRMVVPLKGLSVLSLRSYLTRLIGTAGRWRRWLLEKDSSTIGDPLGWQES